MTSRLRDWALALAATSLLGLGVAQLLIPKPADSAPPANMGRELSYVRVGAPTWGHNHVARASDPAPVLEDNSAYADVTDNKCFGFGTLVQIFCSGEAEFCVSQTATITMGVGTSGGDVTDGEGNATVGDLVGVASGIGACTRVPAGAWKDIIVSQVQFQNEDDVTFRGGYCDTTNATTPFWPCDDDDADCGTSGNCLSPDSDNRGTSQCAFVISNAASQTNCWVQIDR